MLELLHESILPVNLPFTLLLGVVVLYWIIGLLGLVDLEGGGVVEVDGFDGGGDTSVDSSTGGILQGIMKIVGASDAPLIFVISIFSIFLWALNIAGNHFLNPGFEGGRASLLLVPVVIGAFLFTRLLVIPLRPFMKIIRTSETPAQIIGASGRVRSATLDATFGEVEVETEDKNLILRARVSSDNGSLRKGDAILVVSRDPESETYLVRPLSDPL